MKRTNRFLGILFCLGVAVLAAPASADESFTLNIPVRGDASQETGEVRVILGLDSAPAGAQLLLNGTITLNLGGTALNGTDSVTFSAGVGNSVRITYRPLSNFSANNFCAGGGATEKNIPMRFVGTQDVVEYRVASYVVGAPLAECSQVSKRAADLSANIVLTGDGVAPPLAATDRGRFPIDVVLVLDKSGSMQDLPPGAATGATKVQILRTAIKTFVANWRELDQPTPEGLEWSQDRIGVVFFDHTVTAQTLAGADPPANVFVRRGTTIPGPGIATPWDAVLTNINTLAPGGSTSVGGGVNEAMSRWKADPLNDPTIVVVTDGIQNSPPLIQATGTGFLGLAPVAGLPQELRQRFIPIQSIGFGAPAAVDEALLRNMSFETSGRSYIGVNAATVFDDFALTLVSILKGNTASLALRARDAMAVGGPSASRAVIVDQSARRVLFSLQWEPPERDALSLEVFRPGAATASAPTTSESLPQAALQTFDTSPGDTGTWKVRVKRNPGNKLKPNAKVPYTLNVFFLERHLDFQLSLDTLRVAAGDRIGLRVRVAYDHKPLGGLPAGAIRVRIQRPPEGLGTILNGMKTRVKTSSSSGDVKAPYERKVAQVALERILPKDAETISLKEDTKGVYTGGFDNITVPGMYALEVALEWNDPVTGHIRREERLEQHVSVRPDSGKTTVNTVRIDSRTVGVSVTPRDKYGNYLGPGYASAITAKLTTGGKLAEGPPVDRDETGTYGFTVTDVPPGETPKLEIAVDGVRVL